MLNHKLVITGSSGFVGTNFIKSSRQFDIAEVDLLTQSVSELNFVGKDSVLHLAALVHQMKGAPVDQYFKVNRDLAFDVAKRAKEQGVKQFVFMSTAKVYGESTTNKLPWNEQTLCNPVDPYGKSKYEAEKLIQSLEDSSFKVAIVRSPLVYGMGVKANMFNLIGLVNKFPVLPLGGIDNSRSMVYMGNLIALLTQIIETQASGVFIAGDYMPLSTTQLTKLIALGLNKKVLLVKIPNILLKGIGKVKPTITDRLFGSLELDNASTNERLDFIPPYPIEHGVNEMVKWYLDEKN